MTGDPQETVTGDEFSDSYDWPEPRPEQVEVLLLGTYHLEPSESFDSLAPDRQRELRRLVDRLGEWNPDGVAVEWAAKEQDKLDERYAEYRSGDRAYGDDSASGSESDDAMEEDSLKETEIVQIGFRLADDRNHDRVHAVDYPMYMNAHLDEELEQEVELDEFEEMEEKARSELDVPVPGMPDDERRDHLDESTVTEFLRWYNREENLRVNDRGQFAVGLAGSDERYFGAQLLTGWYERNLRIVDNLWRAAEDHDLDRILLVMGQGHSHILRGMLADAPPFCPVNPLPVLSE